MTRNPIPNTSPRDIAAIDLERVLHRLEHNILSSDADPRLRHSKFERIRSSANLEYARTLLLRLEHDSSTIKVQSRKNATQTSLSAQRALIKRLRDRLHDLERTGDDEGFPSRSKGEDEEDILAEYDDPLPPSSTSKASNSEAPATQPTSATAPAPSTQYTTATQTQLRNRLFQNTSSSDPDSAHATGASTSHPSNANTNATQLLEAQDSKQTDLTSTLLGLAQQLRASSAQFSDSLKADTATLDRAVEGLDKNTSGMEAAGKRMGMLRRMSEGKGWWGRIMLYVWIAGLWIVAILLVGIGPKLRF